MISVPGNLLHSIMSYAIAMALQSDHGKEMQSSGVLYGIIKRIENATVFIYKKCMPKK